MTEIKPNIVLKNKKPNFSFLIPTRSNVDMLGNFLDSIVKTTHRIEDVEVVLCIDSDDNESISYEHPDIPCVKTIVQPGTAMGIMNNRCYEASSGEYVMLLNDDVLLRTQGWDTLILDTLNTETDRHILVHVNDMLFGKKLCTFPMMSRDTVGLVGFCPERFQRFAIDDHLFDIFHILRYLGHDRIRYLGNIVFEHLNFHTRSDEDNVRVYKPKSAPEQDWAHYQELLSERKQAALKLAVMIDNDSRNKPVYLKYLENVTLTHEYRNMKAHQLKSLIN